MFQMIFGGLLIVLVCADMGIKAYIENDFTPGEERETIVDRLVLRRVHNQGFCFNMMDRKRDLVKWGSGLTCIGVVIYDIWLFLHKGRPITKLGMIFVSAGALSNTYDRWIRGYVVDYIGVQFKSSKLARWTANLADIYVVIGSIMISIVQFFRR